MNMYAIWKQKKNYVSVLRWFQPNFEEIVVSRIS